MKCPKCKKEVDSLERHHDPPRSRKYKSGDKWFFIDKDGRHKPLAKVCNKVLCRSCHRKTDKGWKLPHTKPPLSKEERGEKRKLKKIKKKSKKRLEKITKVEQYNQLEAINKNLTKNRGS